MLTEIDCDGPSFGSYVPENSTKMSNSTACGSNWPCLTPSSHVSALNERVAIFHGHATSAAAFAAIVYLAPSQNKQLYSRLPLPPISADSDGVSVAATSANRQPFLSAS